MIPVFLAVLVVILVGFFMMFGYELHTPLFKITSKKALTSVQFESAVQTQVLLDNHAFQALQTHRMAELGVLERANLAVPRIQPIVLEDLSTRIKDKELPQKEIGDQTLSTKKQEASVDSGLCSRQEHTSVGSRDETQDDQQRSNTERPEIENLSNEAPKETAIVNS